MARTKISSKLSEQVTAKVKKDKEKEVVDNEQQVFKPFAGDIKHMTSTGSTLLNLAISGGVTKYGGLAGGTFVEISGPSGSGKTVLLCEIAGYVQRNGGQVRFDDPEARINKQFAQMFDFDTESTEFDEPDTVTQLFKSIRAWEPKNPNVVNGTFTDSLAALSTNMEMENEDGDKMGGRRGKEFSEGLRKNCRLIKQKNILMVASNQLRDKMDGTGRKESPGGNAIGFYASVRIRALESEKVFKIIKHKGKEVKKPIGIKTIFEISKNSTWKPYRTAPVYIIFDYGVDNIRGNLQFIKDYSGKSVYTIGATEIGKSMEEALEYIETNSLEQELEDEVVELWNVIEAKFNSVRKNKAR